MLFADRHSSTIDAPSALVDLGDTLCDCSGALHEGLARLLAIVPAQPWNTNAAALPCCVRYDGRNRPALQAALRACREGIVRGTAKAAQKPNITESDRS